MKSILKLYHVDPGFDTSNILTGHITLALDKYPDEKLWRNFYWQILGNLRSQPGVKSAAVTDYLPLYGSSSYETVHWGHGKSREALFKGVSPEYFSVLRIPLLSGRFFTDYDGSQSQPVVIVNETMANHIGRQTAIGSSITFGEEPASHVVIGIVSDVKHAGLGQLSQPEIYVCAWQHAWRWGNVLVRTADDPLKHQTLFLNSIWGVDPDQPVIFLTTMENVLSESTKDYRFVFYLLSFFGVVALVLLLFGIYAVFNYSVAERAQEMGIRIALGARAAEILVLLYKEGALLLLIGILMGSILAANAAGALHSNLFGVETFELLTFLLVAAGISLCACIAILFPALRAIRMNPNTILRNE